jgi:hypothetical protein
VTVSFITAEPDPVGSISALRDEFGDVEFATVPRGWKTLSTAVRLAAGESCTLAYARSAALATRLQDRVRAHGFDLVYVSSSSMIPYALELAPAPPLVLDLGELDSEAWLRQAAGRAFPRGAFFRTEAIRLRRAEELAAQRAATCIVSSGHAAGILAGFTTPVRPQVIPDGVDVHSWDVILRCLTDICEARGGGRPPHAPSSVSLVPSGRS